MCVYCISICKNILKVRIIVLKSNFNINRIMSFTEVYRFMQTVTSWVEIFYKVNILELFLLQMLLYQRVLKKDLVRMQNTIQFQRLGDLELFVKEQNVRMSC